MQSGSVNASLLLSAFLGSEQEKMGAEIARSDFAGELGKLLTPEAASSNTAGNAAANAMQATPDAAVLQAAVSVPENARVAADSVENAAPVKSSRRPSSETPAERIKNLKNRSKVGQNLYITDPTLVASIMAELRYPAETIKAFKNLQNNEGWVSLKDFNTLISSKSGTADKLTQGQVSSAQAQALLGAIVEKSGKGAGSVRNVMSGTGKALVDPGADQLYGRDEFGALIGKVIEKASASDSGRKSQGVTSGKSTVSSGSAVEAVEITGQAEVAPKKGQSESLVERNLPSFISEKPKERRGRHRSDSRESTEAVKTTSAEKTAKTGDPAAEAKTSAVHEKDRAKIAGTSVPAGKNYQKAPASENVPRPTAQNEPIPSDKTAQSQSETIAPAPDETTPALSEFPDRFGKTVISSAAVSADLLDGASLVRSDGRETAAIQGQNAAAISRQTGKDPLDTTSETEIRPARDLADISRAGDGIVTTEAEDTRDRSFPDYDPERSADLFRDHRKTAVRTRQIDGGVATEKTPESTIAPDLNFVEDLDSLLNELRATRVSVVKGGSDARLSVGEAQISKVEASSESDSSEAAPVIKKTSVPVEKAAGGMAESDPLERLLYEFRTRLVSLGKKVSEASVAGDVPEVPENKTVAKPELTEATVAPVTEKTSVPVEKAAGEIAESEPLGQLLDEFRTRLVSLGKKVSEAPVAGDVPELQENKTVAKPELSEAAAAPVTEKVSISVEKAAGEMAESEPVERLLDEFRTRLISLGKKVSEASVAGDVPEVPENTTVAKPELTEAAAAPDTEKTSTPVEKAAGEIAESDPLERLLDEFRTRLISLGKKGSEASVATDVPEVPENKTVAKPELSEATAAPVTEKKSVPMEKAAGAMAESEPVERLLDEFRTRLVSLGKKVSEASVAIDVPEVPENKTIAKPDLSEAAAAPVTEKVSVPVEKAAGEMAESDPVERLLDEFRTRLVSLGKKVSEASVAGDVPEVPQDKTVARPDLTEAAAPVTEKVSVPVERSASGMAESEPVERLLDEFRTRLVSPGKKVSEASVATDVPEVPENKTVAKPDLTEATAAPVTEKTSVPVEKPASGMAESDPVERLLDEFRTRLVSPGKKVSEASVATDVPEVPENKTVAKPDLTEATAAPVTEKVSVPVERLAGGMAESDPVERLLDEFRTRLVSLGKKVSEASVATDVPDVPENKSAAKPDLTEAAAAPVTEKVSVPVERLASGMAESDPVERLLDEFRTRLVSLGKKVSEASVATDVPDVPENKSAAKPDLTEAAAAPVTEKASVPVEKAASKTPESKPVEQLLEEFRASLAAARKTASAAPVAANATETAEAKAFPKPESAEAAPVTEKVSVPVEKPASNTPESKPVEQLLEEFRASLAAARKTASAAPVAANAAETAEAKPFPKPESAEAAPVTEKVSVPVENAAPKTPESKPVEQLLEEFRASLAAARKTASAAPVAANAAETAEAKPFPKPESAEAAPVTEKVSVPVEKAASKTPESKPVEQLLEEFRASLAAARKTVSDAAVTADESVITQKAESLIKPEQAAVQAANYREKLSVPAEKPVRDLPESIPAEPVSAVNPKTDKANLTGSEGKTPASHLNRLANLGGEAGENVSTAQQAGEALERGLSERTTAPSKSVSTAAMEISQASRGHEATIFSKDVEKQLKVRDSAIDPVVLHSAPIRSPGAGMETVPMDHASAGNFNYYDPGRTVELFEAYREQYSGLGGKQLVLELEPEELGKVSVRVGAHNDDVSAVVLTENESAKQALLKHSSELRQDMENQGLSLGKFTVDVDRERTGSSPERQQPDGGKDSPAQRQGGGSTGQLRHKPRYMKMDGRVSQVSIFA